MASALLEELKIVATEAKRSQIEDAVGSSWGCPSGGRGPSKERVRNSTGRIGEQEERGGEGGGGGGGGCGGGGVGQREQWEDPMATQSDREIELSPDQPRGRRSLRGSCTSRPIKALARPPRTPWEEAPARSPNPRKCGDEESYGKV